MRNVFIVFILFIFLIFCFDLCQGDMFDFKGQISAWSSFGDDGQIGLRYLPEIGISYPLSKEKIFDAEISANLYAYAPYDSMEDIDNNAEAKLYRTWTRYSSTQYEIRCGLQKINFGPAKLLRSLMWFDDLDPRDPLKLTDGVYALLGRYYFINNANIWLWGLYGNGGLKGLETFETDRDHVEFGGRWQFPAPRGEMAFSFDSRHIDKKDWRKKISSDISYGIENRYAIDGSFDIGPGIWFEAVASEIKIHSGNSLWRRFMTVGADYTFDIGPGIHILYEHFLKSTDSEIDRQDKSYNVSALSIDFSLSALDNINAIGYYNWKEDKSYCYVAWQRAYDNWLINLSIFSNPESAETVYSGTGALCLISYNY